MYKTKQKELILNIIKKQHREFSVKDIYDEVSDNVGLTTVYRVINKLEEDNKIKKIINNNDTYYLYLEECDKDNHFNLKCIRCGKLIHIDCDCINELSKHINNKHNFKIENNNLVINGICNKCIKGDR